jgi:hypothetical protein
MDEIHCLHRYGQYSFNDVMEMTARERSALLDRTNKAMQLENEALEKATRGK